MPLHHLFRLGASLAISGAAAAARRDRQLNQQSGTIIIQHTNQPCSSVPGEGYLPGYQQFINQPTSVIIGAPQPVVVQPNVKPDSYMVLAILATIFCFFPFGIPAIVYASQVDSAYESGDFIKAQSSSSGARGWTIAACITGVICYSLIGMMVYIVLLNHPYSDDE